MQANQKKRFKEFDGHYKNILKLTKTAQIDAKVIEGIKQSFKFEACTFKPNDYI